MSRDLWLVLAQELPKLSRRNASSLYFDCRLMSRVRFHLNSAVFRHAWLNLCNKHMTTGRINQISVVLLTILNTSSYSIGQANGDPCSTNVVVSQLTQLCDNRQISHVRVANAFTPAKHLLHWANVPRTDTKTNTFCLPIQTERIHTDLSQNTIQAAIDCDTTNNIKWCI